MSLRSRIVEGWIGTDKVALHQDPHVIHVHYAVIPAAGVMLAEGRGGLLDFIQQRGLHSVGAAMERGRECPL